MKRRHIIVVIALALSLATGGSGWWYFRTRAQSPDQLAQIAARARQAKLQVARQLDRRLGPSELPGMRLSGFVEAREVVIMSEVPGQMVKLTKAEGEEVRAGDLLIQLDDLLLEAQLNEAEAAVELAEARLARTQVGTPPDEIRRLEATVTKAEVSRQWAEMAWQDATAIRQDPQDLTVEIVESRARVQALDHQLEQALAMKDAAEIAKSELSRTVTWLRGGFDIEIPLPGGGTRTRHFDAPESKIEDTQDELNAATTQWWQAWVSVNTASTSKEWAEAALSDLLAIQENPQDLQAQVDAARTQYEQAEAALEVARAQLALARAGTREEDLAVARAQLTLARSAYSELAADRDKRRLRSPITGRVTELSVHEGETISPGAPLLTLADLDEVTLTLYVPEADVARVTVGQPAHVTVDSYPGREFVGQVARIDDEAQFTPRNVQTQDERASTVFAVTVRLPNPDGALKAGMPADALLGGAGEEDGYGI